MNKLNKFIDKFKMSSRKDKLKLILAAIGLIALLMFMCCYASGTVMRALYFDHKASPLKYSFKGYGKYLTYALWIFVIGGFLYLTLKTTKQNRSSTFADDRGVNYMEKGTFGTAQFGNKEEDLIETFNICNVKDTTEPIYGQLTDKGEKVVAFKWPEDGAEGNKNLFMLAGMGKGKSYCIVRPNTIQALKNGDSVVLTDPSGELVSSMSYLIQNRKIKDKDGNPRDIQLNVFNLKNPEYSDYWNCLQETISDKTERVDGRLLTQFVQIYMENSGNGKKDFWYDSALNLLEAIIGYTAYQHEKHILGVYNAAYLTAIKNDRRNTNDEYTNAVNKTMVSLKWCREYIKKKAEENGMDTSELEKVFVSAKQEADRDYPFTLKKVYENLMNWQEVQKVFGNDKGNNGKGKPGSEIPPFHPAMHAYTTFMSQDTQQIRLSAVQGCQLRFSLFVDKYLLNALSYDGINLKDINKKQSITFVVTNDTSSDTKPIASLFFSFLFKDVQDEFDKYKQMATYDIYSTVKEEDRIKNPCIPVSVIMDEFFSLGVLGGSPNGVPGQPFADTMSNSRKRKLYITIICQVYSQIEALYGKFIRDVIKGGCATMVYMGDNDESSMKFISEYAGTASVLDESHIEQGKIIESEALRGSYSAKAAKRDLVTYGEARTLLKRRQLMLFGDYVQPAIINQFPWSQLPEYEKGRHTNIYELIKSQDERYGIYNEHNDYFKERNKLIDIDRQAILQRMFNSASNNEPFNNTTLDNGKVVTYDTETGEIVEDKQNKSSQNSNQSSNNVDETEQKSEASIEQLIKDNSPKFDDIDEEQEEDIQPETIQDNSNNNDTNKDDDPFSDMKN